MRENEHEGVRETMIREFVIASKAGDHTRAKNLLRRMNAVEYLVALDRLRGGDESKQLPPWVRRN